MGWHTPLVSLGNLVSGTHTAVFESWSSGLMTFLFVCDRGEAADVGAF